MFHLLHPGMEWFSIYYLASVCRCERERERESPISDACWQLWTFQYWISFKPVCEVSTVEDKFPPFYQQPFFTSFVRKCTLFAPHTPPNTHTVFAQSKVNVRTRSSHLLSAVICALPCNVALPPIPALTIGCFTQSKSKLPIKDGAYHFPWRMRYTTIKSFLLIICYVHFVFFGSLFEWHRQQWQSRN